MNSRKLLAIIRKELGHYFSSLTGYVVLFVYSALGGYFYYMIMVQTRQAGMSQIFGTLTFVLLFLTPLVTMRLWSEEEKSGTAELLKTSPLTVWEIVVGKFLGVCAFFVVMSVPTFVYLLIILATGNPDLPPILANYLGYFLCAMTFFSIGLLASTLSENQIVAAVVAFAINLVLWVIGYASAGEGKLSDLMKYLCLSQQMDDFLRGIIDLTHFFYFGSLIFLGLFFSVKVLEGKRN